jgi:transposase
MVHLKNLHVAELLDKHFQPNGHGQGLSLGGTTVVWLTCILSAGDHRLSRVEPWVTAHQRTLSRCIGRQVTPRDLTDARLATILDYLGVAERWGAFARALNQSGRRVYALPGRVVRLDTTPAAASVTPEGLCQLGHSQAQRPALPPVQVAMSVLDPLGLPLTTTVVAGQTAADPLSLPEIAQVRQSAGTIGLTYVGACKLAALGTRAEIVAPQDYDWCPLAAKQMPEAERERVLAPVFRDALAPSAIRVPHTDGTLAETDDPVALGFTSTVELSAPEPAGQAQTWHARRRGVRSLAWAARQEQSLRQRVARAVTELNALDKRKQGKPRWPDAAAASQAAAAILAKHRVEGLVTVTVTTDVHEAVKRRYGTRLATTVRREHVRVGAASDKVTLAHTVRRLGWRVYATNHTAEALSLAQGGAA